MFVTFFHLPSNVLAPCATRSVTLSISAMIYYHKIMSLNLMKDNFVFKYKSIHFTAHNKQQLKVFHWKLKNCEAITWFHSYNHLEMFFLSEFNLKFNWSRRMTWYRILKMLRTKNEYHLNRHILIYLASIILLTIICQTILRTLFHCHKKIVELILLSVNWQCICKEHFIVIRHCRCILTFSPKVTNN